MVIYGHSCFKNSSPPRRAKLHAAMPFVKFAQFADKRTLHVDLLKRRIIRMKRISLIVLSGIRMTKSKNTVFSSQWKELIIAVKTFFHRSENFLSLQWKLSFIAVKTFNHCDENFLSFDSAQTTSLLRTTEKAFLQMGKWPSAQAAQNLPAAFAGNGEMVMHRIEKVSLSEAA